MFRRGLLSIVLGLAAMPVAALPGRLDGVTGLALPAGADTAAAAWRRGGTQVLTVTRGNGLLFWNAATGRLIDSTVIAGLPPPPADWQVERRTTLAVSRDDRYAAITVVAGGTPTTVIVDLATQHATAHLARPALFWTAAGLVAGPAPGCAAACDFALITPTAEGTSERPLGTAFGDGWNVAATGDGSRFATIAGPAAARELIVWSTATWSPVARAALPAAAVFEVGFDASGSHAFVRNAEGKLVVLDVAAGTAVTRALPPPIADMTIATDLDHNRAMTLTGPIALDAQVARVRLGSLQFYTADPRYGAIYAFDDGSAAAIGGRPAASNAFPWQVELQYRAPPGSGFSPVVLHNCGGSLIKPGWVVTATHCFLTADNVLRSDEEAIAHTVVRAGNVDLTGDMKSFDVVGVYIRRCTPEQASGCFHDSDPDAQPPTPPTDDIALLHIVPHVDPPVHHNYTLSPPQIGRIEHITLPASDRLASATPVTMTGWGAVSAEDQHEMSPVLNRVDLTVMPAETCSARHGFGPLSPAVICAGSSDDRQLACRGDSGGPLVADIAAHPVLVGVVSWGNCFGGPAIYTRVAAYLPWIKATIAAAEKQR